MTLLTIDDPGEDSTVECPGGYLTALSGTAIVPIDRLIDHITVRIHDPATGNCCTETLAAANAPIGTSETEATYNWTLPADSAGARVCQCSPDGEYNEIRAEMVLDDDNSYPADPEPITFKATCAD